MPKTKLMENQQFKDHIKNHLYLGKEHLLVVKSGIKIRILYGPFSQDKEAPLTCTSSDFQISVLSIIFM